MVTKRALGILLILIIIGFASDMFLLRPTGVYSYTKGEAYDYVIGMNKEQAFNRMRSKGEASVVLSTREPFHQQFLTKTKGPELTRELETSNNWVMYESANLTYQLIFRDGKVRRILGHSRRFGELETGLSMFSVSYPMKTSEGAIEDADTFAGLTPKQINELVLGQREWTRVFLD